MRVPAPAAGMIPHMSPSPEIGRRALTGAPAQHLLELRRTAVGGVLDQRPLPRALRDAPELLVGSLDRVNRSVTGGGDEDLLVRFEELVEPWPRVGQNRRAARR